jgi:hypothetical protein
MPRKRYDQVMQFKITLEGIQPPIWRRIQVPENYTFWDLHVAITDAMGWLDCHLHEFEVVNRYTGTTDTIGLPDPDAEDWDTLPDWHIAVGMYLTLEHPACSYLYDFGDGWQHTVTLEEILPRKRGVRYPRCVAGERACPPEDCGSIPGYQRILEALADRGNEEFADQLEWLGDDYDPEVFDPDGVHFWDPQVRLKMAFSDE